MNLKQVTIPSINLEKATIFYQKLGLRLIVDARPRYVRLECPEGEATFSIHLIEILPVGEGISVYFELENLDEKVAELVKQGIEFLEMPKDRNWLWREARLLDPDGNKIVFFFCRK